MPKRKLLDSINELWNNQYTYFILIGFIVGISTGFSNVIFHFFYSKITDLFLNPLAEKNMVIFGTLIGGLILFFMTYVTKKNDILGTLKVFYKDELINEYQVLAFEDVKKVNIFSEEKIVI